MSIKLNIKSASNLIPVAADGTYSPFVIVYVGDMKDSKQQTPQASTLNPGWTHGNSMIFELKSGIRFEDVIHFEVKDFQSKFKGSNQIGYCQLPLWRILLNNGQEWRLSLKRDAVLSGFLTIETLLVNRAELKLLEQSARLMLNDSKLNDYIGTTGVWYLQLVGAKDFKADVLPKNLMATVSISKTRSFTTKAWGPSWSEYAALASHVKDTQLKVAITQYAVLGPPKALGEAELKIAELMDGKTRTLKLSVFANSPAVAGTVEIKLAWASDAERCPFLTAKDHLEARSSSDFARPAFAQVACERGCYECAQIIEMVLLF